MVDITQVFVVNLSRDHLRTIVPSLWFYLCTFRPIYVNIFAGAYQIILCLSLIGCHHGVYRDSMHLCMSLEKRL